MFLCLLSTDSRLPSLSLFTSAATRWQSSRDGFHICLDLAHMLVAPLWAIWAAVMTETAVDSSRSGAPSAGVPMTRTRSITCARVIGLAGGAETDSAGSLGAVLV